MAKSSVELLTPVGRLVQGSLYRFNTTDAENRPLVYKTGKNAGQPRAEYFFRLAIPKGNESHWNQTEWGAKVWNVGQTGFPNGSANSPNFAWKIIDGDSTIPNREGTKPCDQEGFSGHWILKFASSFAPTIYNADGTVKLTEENAVNLGDYVEVFCTVEDNGSSQQPGIYFNPIMVALAGYGIRISTGLNPKAVGFGQAALPAGASKIPVSQGFTPPPAAVAAQSAAPAPVAPYTAILTPPAPSAPPVPVAASKRTMTAEAGGISYEEYIKSGWTDALLIQHGKMLG